MAFQLPPLPYAKDALAPHGISEETLEYHYGKHHQAYIDNLNKLVAGTDDENASLEDVIMKADVQGAATVKAMAPGAVMIFLASPSLEELERRLRLRQSESAEALKLRMDAVEREMANIEMFEYKVVNHNQRLDIAAFCIDSIITAEKCRIPPRQVSI